MQQESSGRMGAKRYEPGFHSRYVSGRGFGPDEEEFRSTSWGLFQLMGEVLRELGFRGNAEQFCADPQLQLEMFNAQWSKILRRFPVGKSPQWRRIEAWNKGIGGASKLGSRSSYGESVQRRMAAAPVGKNGKVKVRFS